MQTLRQIEFSLFDLLIHSHTPALDYAGILSTLDNVRSDIAIMETLTITVLPMALVISLPVVMQRDTILTNGRSYYLQMRSVNLKKKVSLTLLRVKPSARPFYPLVAAYPLKLILRIFGVVAPVSMPYCVTVVLPVLTTAMHTLTLRPADALSI